MGSPRDFDCCSGTGGHPNAHTGAQGVSVVHVPTREQVREAIAVEMEWAQLHEWKGGPVMTHEIVWTFERDHVEARAVCNDPECLNRYVCTEACEVYVDVRREDDGTVTHAPWDDDSRAVIRRHRMEKSEDCSLLDFLNADPSELPELAIDTEPFEIGRTTVDAVWQGEDGALWKRIEVTS